MNTSCAQLSNYRGRYNRCKSNGVVVRLRMGYDFSMLGKISLGGLTMLIKTKEALTFIH